MTTKPRNFDTNLYYHIYNCGVEKRDVFVTERDYQRFLETVNYYLYDHRISYAQFQDLNPKVKQIYTRLNPKGLETLRVKLISYCLIPNHFHFALKLAKKDGITRFISDISNSYTRYFNIKNERIGSLFQGTFKCKEISTEEALLQVTRYHHLNPVFSSKTNQNGTLKPEDYPYSSYGAWIDPSYLNPKGLEIDYVEAMKLIALVGGPEGYKEFVESKIDSDPKIGIENLVIE